MMVKKFKSIHIHIGFLLHHTLKFFLVYFHGLTLKPMRNSLKRMILPFGEICIVGMIKSQGIGWL